jgi:hypothetical protein
MSGTQIAIAIDTKLPTFMRGLDYTFDRCWTAHSNRKPQWAHGLRDDAVPYETLCRANDADE